MKYPLHVTHDKIEALACRIYLQERCLSDHARNHWQRAQDALRNLRESRPASPEGDVSIDSFEGATLLCQDHPAIFGLAVIHRKGPEDAMFYPASLQEMRMPLGFPATLHLDETGEIFHLARLQPGENGDACLDISFRKEGPTALERNYGWRDER